jgi:hypothetical protein
MAGKVFWNGEEATHLPSIDDDLVAIQLPPLHKGHHSIFVQLVCDASCPHPVNGSVFFEASAAAAGSAAPPSAPSAARPAAGGLFTDEALERVRDLTCTQADLDAFLPGHFSSADRRPPSESALPGGSAGGSNSMEAGEQMGRPRRAFPSETELCAALAALHAELWQAVEQRPHDHKAWGGLARWLVSRGRVRSAVGLYRTALRLFTSATTGRQVTFVSVASGSLKAKCVRDEREGSRTSATGPSATTGCPRTAPLYARARLPSTSTLLGSDLR